MLGTALFANQLINSKTTVVKTTPNVDAADLIVQYLEKDGYEKDGLDVKQDFAKAQLEKQDFGELENVDKANNPVLDKDDALDKDMGLDLNIP